MRIIRRAAGTSMLLSQYVSASFLSLATHSLLGVAILACDGGARPKDTFESHLELIHSPKSALSESGFRVELLEAQSRIKSIYFDYIGDDAYRRDVRFPPGTFLRRIVAAKSPCFFSHETAHGCDTTPWADDIRRRRCIVQDDRAYDIWVTNRSFAITQPWAADDPLPGSMPGEPVMLAIGIWPLTDRPSPRPVGQPVMLADVARDPGYRLREHLENVADHHCHVFEKEGVDRLWIDSKLGYSLIARDHYDLETGERFLRHELTGHQEIKPGIWMPSAFRVIRYHHQSSDPAARGEVLSDLCFRITECSVNDVADEFFNFKPQPGALCLNPGGKESVQPMQAVAGGVDHLDELVAWASRRDLLSAEVNGRFVFWIKITCLITAMCLIMEVGFRFAGNRRVDTR